MIELLKKQIQKAPKAIRPEASRPASQRPTPAEKSDRRLAARHPCSLRTSGRLLGKQDDTPWSATIRDISRGGVGLLSSECFPRGTILVFKLEDAGQRFPRPLLVRVVRTIKQPKGDWLLGCTFAGKLRDEDLEALLGTEKDPADIPA